MSEKVQELIELIKGLSVLEIAEAVKVLEEEFGVSAAAPVAVAAAGAAAGAEAGAAKSDFEVVLASAGAEKVKVIKVVKEITGLGLKEAKAIVDEAPKTLKEGVSQADADEMKEKLEAVGATVELK